MSDVALLFMIVTVFWLLVTLLSVVWWWRRGPRVANRNRNIFEPTKAKPDKHDWRRQVINVANALALFHVFLAVLAAKGDPKSIIFATLSLVVILPTYYFLAVTTRQYHGQIDAYALTLKDREPIRFSDITAMEIKDLWGRDLIVVKLRNGKKRRIAKWRINDFRVFDGLSTAVIQIYNPGRVACPIAASEFEQMQRKLLQLETIFEASVLRPAVAQ